MPSGRSGVQLEQVLSVRLAIKLGRVNRIDVRDASACALLDGELNKRSARSVCALICGDVDW